MVYTLYGNPINIPNPIASYWLAMPCFPALHLLTMTPDQISSMRQLEEQDASLASFLVGQQQLPTLHYIPDFISPAEERRLASEVHASKAKWVQLSGRRLQNHGGIVHTKGLIPAPMPGWLQQLIASLPQRLAQLFPPDQPPNHVLINSYQPGCGIMPHEDGPLYHPVVLILSLGSPAVLRFWRKQESGGTGGQPPVASLLAKPRSLLVFQDDAYTHCLHGIEEVSQETLDSSVVNTAAAGAEAAGLQHLQQQQQQQQAQVAQADRNGSPAQPATDVVSDALTDSGQGTPCCCAGAQAAGGDAPLLLPRQGERVSLTIRRVLKVHKALGILGKR